MIHIVKCFSCGGEDLKHAQSGKSVACTSCGWAYPDDEIAAKSMPTVMGFFAALKAVLGAKYKLVMCIGVPVLIALLLYGGFGVFRFGRNIFWGEARTTGITIDVLENIRIDDFRFIPLEIQTANAVFLDIEPGGFINPGILTFRLNYHSTVIFEGNADRLRMRRTGDFVFVDESSIYLDTRAFVWGFERTATYRTNPFVRINQGVIDQMNARQEEYASEAESRVAERYMATAKGNFKASFENFLGELDLIVIWE